MEQHLSSVQTGSRSQEQIRCLACDDGYQLHYRCWPAQGAAAATIILVNGMMSHSGWFLELADLLGGSQMNVVGADRRGTGLNQSSRGDAPSAQILISDLRKMIQEEDRGLPIYLVGWSWGAVPAVHVALELGRKLSGLVLMAPGLFPSLAVKRAVQEGLAAGGGMKPEFPGLRSPLTPEMFSDRQGVREFIRHDELTQRMFTRRFFQIAGEMSVTANLRLSQLTTPLLLLLATRDQTADNQRTLKAVQRLARTSVTTATLDCHHAMQFEVPREIVQYISCWMQGCNQPLTQSA